MALVRRGKRIYLYRTEREPGRRRTRYVSRGPDAEAIAAALDTARLLARQDRWRRRSEIDAAIDAMLETDAEIDRTCEDIQILARATLIASGFHTHGCSDNADRLKSWPGNPSRGGGRCFL